MSNAVKTPQCPFLIDLDAEVMMMPGKSLESMLGIFAHLESLALRKTKDLSSGISRPDSLKATMALSKSHSLDKGAGEKISFRQLGRQVIRAARGQVQVLQKRTHEMQSLVLINNWSVAEKLWLELLPDCKTPLFELNFLEELWGISPERLAVAGWSLIRHWQQFVLIQAQVEVLLARRQNLVQLSDTLEGHLGLWLKRFDEILEKLDEHSAP